MVVGGDDVDGSGGGGGGCEVMVLVMVKKDSKQTILRSNLATVMVIY